MPIKNLKKIQANRVIGIDASTKSLAFAIFENGKPIQCGEIKFKGSNVFERAYWALAAQRNTRILGVFTRLWKRDNKPGYRRFQPRMWGLLERDLAQPGLEPVRDWFDVNVRPEHRIDPWRQAA